jgi:hypothetical protein
MKPSDRIKGYYSEEDSRKEIYLADAYDVRREIDALHDRIEALTEQNLALAKQCNFMQNDILNLQMNSKPKQEPKCEHDGYSDIYWCGDRAYKKKFLYPTCPYCPTEKKEKLADLLKAEYQPQTNPHDLNFTCQAKACIKAVEKVIRELDCWGESAKSAVIAKLRKELL